MSKRSQRRKRASRGAASDAVATLKPQASIGAAPGSGTAHRAASGTDPAFAGWTPPLRDPNTSHAWERDTEVARVRDLVANNEHAAAAVDRHTAMTVGQRYRYSARHEKMAELLGLETDVALDLASQIEKAFTSWSQDPLNRCDWTLDQDFDGMLELAERTKFVDGEAFAVLRWNEGELPRGWKWRTSLQMFDTDRVSNPMGRMNGPFEYQTEAGLARGELINGIETNGRFVTAYHVRDAHPADVMAFGRSQSWKRVPAFEEWGRPKVLHLRDKRRPGEARGLSRFIACLKVFKEFAGMKESELSNAAMNALFGGFIKTTKPSGEVAEMLGLPQLSALGALRKEFYEGVDPRLSNGARMVPLAPGDEAELATASRNASAFQVFTTLSLQGIAASLGLAGSQLTMDFSKTNFSSWRGEMLEVWRGIVVDRMVLEKRFANPVLFAVIEEGIESGEIVAPEGCPDLYECPAGWLAGRWIGPSRGTIDPGGEVDAANKLVSGGFSTLEDEALELRGADYQAVAGQSQFERELWKGKGLTPTAHRELTGMASQPGAAAPVTPAPEPEAEPAEDPATETV